MKPQLIATVGTPKPLDTQGYQPSTIEQVLIVSVLGPIVLLCANEIWGVIKSRVTRGDKRHEAQLKTEQANKEAELKNKDAVLNEMMTGYRALMNDVMSRNEEEIKTLQAMQATTVQVLGTVAENLKHYAEVAMKRSDETRLILEEIRKASTHTVLESMNSHIKINQISLNNQREIIALLRRLHERIDDEFGDSRNKD